MLAPVIEGLNYSTIAYCSRIKVAGVGEAPKHCVTHHLRRLLTAIEIPKDAEGVWTFGADS